MIAFIEHLKMIHAHPSLPNSMHGYILYITYIYSEFCASSNQDQTKNSLQCSPFDSLNFRFHQWRSAHSALEDSILNEMNES